jgi:FkbM family methyltransferase
VIARLYKNRFFRSIGLPILKAFNRDITIRHHWVDRKIDVNLFAHKGYWYHGRRRETEEMEAIQALISPGQSVVEVGGHIGYLSLWFAECVGQGAGAAVTVFEPGSNNLPYIRSNVGGIKQIRLIEKGCGPKAGKLEFFEDSLTGQNNSFVRSFEGLHDNMAAAPNVDVQINQRTVDVVRLDTELGDVVPDFVKIDVEGFELSVLLGADGWFMPGQKPPIIMIEVQANYDEITSWLHERGYTLFDKNNRELAVIPHSTLNLFALNREHHKVHLARWRQSRH